MKFIHDDYLLQNKFAKALYHDYAAEMPIIDYHCHLPPVEVAEDKKWENMTQVWLAGDHYKWRAMRSNGIAERYITGDADDREKFQQFAATMPYLLRNPLYDWSHLELKRYFGIDELLSPATSTKIWEITRGQLAGSEFSARALMRRSNVKLVCTTDDPVDTLEHHTAVAQSGFDVRMLPTWRPDKVLAVDRCDLWNEWVDRLSAAAEIEVDSWDALLEALQHRHDFFDECGCCVSDYGLHSVYAAVYREKAVRKIFAKVRGAEPLSADEISQLRSALLYECIAMDARSDWSVQIHYGAMRNNNTKMFDSLGPDSGFDSIGDCNAAQDLASLFNRLESNDLLPRVIVYNLNPRDNEMLATMLGNFQRAPEAGRMQFGSGWWFNDQRDGMLRQMEALSQLGLLSRFVGMLTDSRSFLSYTRHEYFRRILCNMLGTDISEGRIPDDIEWVGEIVKDICYRNAVRYFGFDFDNV